MRDHDAMRWDGGPGHCEVWYLSATDRSSGLGRAGRRVDVLA